MTPAEVVEPIGGYTLHQRLRAVADDYARLAALVPDAVDEMRAAVALRLLVEWAEVVPRHREAGR